MRNQKRIVVQTKKALIEGVLLRFRNRSELRREPKTTAYSGFSLYGFLFVGSSVHKTIIFRFGNEKTNQQNENKLLAYHLLNDLNFRKGIL